MWISKRKWNEMEDKIDWANNNSIKTITKITELEEKLINYNWLNNTVRELELAHKDEIYTYVDGNRCTRTKRKYSHEQEEIKTSTDTIKDITLEELARFVIDHEPIVREENVKVKVEYR